MKTRHIACLSFVLACNAAFALDTFDAATNQLVIPDVKIGDMVYHDVIVKLSNISVVSVGSVSPAIPATGAVADNCLPENFTKVRYDAIKVGMTADQVNQVLGCKWTPKLTLQNSERTWRGWQYQQTSTNTLLVISAAFDPVHDQVEMLFGKANTSTIGLPF
jgi:hypothetical protein